MNRTGPDATSDHVRVDLPIATWRGLGLAALSGAAATVALALSPYGPQVPPIVVPYTIIDLRFVGLPLTFMAVHIAMARAPWPYPALVLPGLAVSLAVSAHFQGSVLLDFLTELSGTEEGTRVGLGRTVATGVSLIAALGATLERARDRFALLAERAGVRPERLDAIRRLADDQANQTLAFTGAAYLAFALVARIGDGMLGASRAPLAEVVGVVLAVALAVLLFPGVVGAVRERLGV